MNAPGTVPNPRKCVWTAYSGSGDRFFGVQWQADMRCRPDDGTWAAIEVFWRIPWSSCVGLKTRSCADSLARARRTAGEAGRSALCRHMSSSHRWDDGAHTRTHIAEHKSQCDSLVIVPNGCEGRMHALATADPPVGLVASQTCRYFGPHPAMIGRTAVCW